MYNKVSNIAEREMLEREFDIPFKFPKLYRPNTVISGAEESLLSIITIENSNHISYGIWGILPNNYKEEWIDFQNVLSTLSVQKEKLNENSLYKEPFKTRRCLIIVTGFFTHHLYNGELYPYYVYLKTKKPFCLAGVYNTLEDGFITCSVVATQATGTIKKIQNVNTRMPVIVSEKSRDMWLDKDVDIDTLNNILDSQHEFELNAHPIAKEFFKNGISYHSMFDPINYENIPLG